MMKKLSEKSRARFVGLLILLAYSMLTYTITNNKILGIITDIISGIAVIGVPLLLYPLFKLEKDGIVYAYILSRLIEGALMIVGGGCIVITSFEGYREMIYESIHIYFFIVGAWFFYILLYKTHIVPRFISIWGLIATILLLLNVILKLLGVTLVFLDICIIPLICNEFFLVFWFIYKGFSLKKKLS